MRRLALLLLLGAMARPALSQSGFYGGLGAGVGDVTRSEGGGSDVSPAMSAELGIGVGRGVAFVLEAARFGTLDDDPRTTDITPSGTLLRDPGIFETTTLLASLSVPLGGDFYARPGVGAGSNAFASYRVGASTVESAEVSHEWGPAAGLALGCSFAISSVRVGVEGAALWSGGEDSSADRTILALRVVPRFRL
jgi:hypothetical protein